MTIDAELTVLRPATGRRSERRRATQLQVVLLTAGMGTRLGREEPKPLTPLRDGRCILQRQLDGLREVLGASVPITAVVGYRRVIMNAAAPDI